MKSLVYAAVAVASLFSVTSFAQSSNGPMTRAQVQEQLVQLEQVGYQASTHDSDYPRDIQAAEAKLQALGASSQSAYSAAAQQTTAGAR